MEDVIGPESIILVVSLMMPVLLVTICSILALCCRASWLAVLLQISTLAWSILDICCNLLGAAWTLAESRQSAMPLASILGEVAVPFILYSVHDARHKGLLSMRVCHKKVQYGSCCSTLDSMCQVCGGQTGCN